MRIGLIRMRYTPYGGAETFLHRFISELIRQGHTIDVFSADWQESPGVTLHRVKAFGPSFLRGLSFAMNAKKTVDRVKPDIVISLERTYCQDIYRAGDGCHREWLIRRSETVSPFKRLLMALNPSHAAMLYLEKRLFSSERLKKVVANSTGVKADIMRHYGLPEEKICVIYNGIDGGGLNSAATNPRTQKRKALGIGDDAVVILFVGSGFERKGLIYLIRALGLLKDRAEVKLLVIGKGKTDRYAREAERLGVADRVIFKGPVKDAVDYYTAGDIFALPSIYEPFSNACLEALAAGLPVVTSRVNGASEVITDGENGAILEDPADAAEIARRITPFLSKDKRDAAVEPARNEALRHPIEKTVSGFLKVIEQIRGAGD